MKITISVGGKFHAFHLARELEKREGLRQLITSYPKKYLEPFGIPKEKIYPRVLKEIIQRGWEKTPFLKFIWNPQFFVHELFDRSAAQVIQNVDLFVGWSSFALHTLRVAKKKGALCVVERGSSHISYQSAVLHEEYGKFNIKSKIVHPKILEKELQEYKEADYISIPSQFVKRTFLENGISEKKLIHVPYGVDLREFRQAKKEDSVFRVVFAGGMSIRKGVHYLLQAFSELNLPNSELLLIGGMNEEIKTFFKKYNGKFKYVGKIPQSELYKYFSNSSVFVMMSLEEGLALVIPQAMACGLPVIATTNTGAEDIVRDKKDGFIIPIREVNALKEKLVYMYENPEICIQMGRSAKEQVSSGFTWDDYGNKMYEIYKEILARKNDKKI